MNLARVRSLSPRCPRRRRPPPRRATPSSRPSTARQIVALLPPGRRAGRRRRRRSSRATAGAARARPTRTARRDEATGNVGVGAAAQGRLQRADLGLARVRQLRRHGRRSTRRTSRAATSQALIDWLAKQPEAQLDERRRPARGHDRRLLRGRDRARRPRRSTSASTRSRPTIAWHSLLTALYKEETVKGGWARALRRRRGLAPAGVSPAGADRQPGPAHHVRLRQSGATHRQALRRGPRLVRRRAARATLVEQIRVPTLLVQGTADTLFTLDEAITNYAILAGNGVPTKMVWFCGGHGACLTGSGPAGPRRGRRRSPG